jgi:hypothetical protein
MTTQFPEDPLNHIITWQTKFKQYQMETPYVTKDSRESLHNTSNATDSIKDWRTFWKDVLDETEEKLTTNKKRLINDFSDIICGALEEMSGEEIFECFFEAALERHQCVKKEYDKANQLISKFTNE